MLMSASPGRGGGDGAGAGRAQRATGSSPTIANSAAPTVVALSLARSALRSSGSERSAEFGSVNQVRCPHARARGGADSSALGGRPTCTGRLGGAAAAGRRRHFFLAELLLAASAADDGDRAIGADADVGFAGSGAAAMVPAPVERSQLPGHRQRSQIPQHRQWYSVNRDRCPHARAREAGADSSALGRRPTCTGRLGGAAAAGRRRHFFLVELLLADSGADAGARDRRRC